MSGRTRNMAADAAHLAGVGAGPSGSASGHRAHRRLRAEQGRAASGALERSRPWPGAAQVGFTRLLRLGGSGGALDRVDVLFGDLIDRRIDRAHGETLGSERVDTIERGVEVKPP